MSVLGVFIQRYLECKIEEWEELATNGETCMVPTIKAFITRHSRRHQGFERKSTSQVARLADEQ